MTEGNRVVRKCVAGTFEQRAYQMLTSYRDIDEGAEIQVQSATGQIKDMGGNLKPEERLIIITFSGDSYVFAIPEADRLLRRVAQAGEECGHIPKDVQNLVLAIKAGIQSFDHPEKRGDFAVYATGSERVN